MKRFLLTGLLIAGLSGLNQAQTLRLGLRAGLNLGSANLRDADGIRSIVGASASTMPAVKPAIVTGYHAGVIVNIDHIAGSRFSLQPELLYSQYGVRYNGGTNPDGRTNSAEVKTNTVEIPVLVKYTFDSRAVHYFVNAGPFVNYTLKGTLLINTGYFTLPEAVQFGSESRRIAYGLTAGAGVTLPAGPGDLLLEARFNYALHSRISQFNDTNDHLILGMISVGYLLPLHP